MRKITKICDLSTVYKLWEENLEANNQPHPEWEDSKTRKDHYLDLKMQLLRCQDGLCIYSEQRLCPKELLETNKWAGGKYTHQDPDKQVKGDVEHFDDRLKKAPLHKAWLWDNLFVADHTINNHKRTQTLDARLKPCSANFDPFQLFDYDIVEHRFSPKASLEFTDKSLYEAVKNAIDKVLKLNSLKDDRKEEILKKYAPNYESGFEVDVYQFPTAWEFWQRKQAHHITDTHPTADEYE